MQLTRVNRFSTKYNFVEQKKKHSKTMQFMAKRKKKK